MHRQTTIESEAVATLERYPGFLIAVPVLVLLLGIQPAHAQFSTDLTPADRASLERGDILLETIHYDKPGGAARITSLFHATTDQIWNVIGYCKNEFVFLNGLKLCEVLKPGLRNTVVHHQLRPHWYTPTLDYTFEASRTPCCHAQFKLVEGDLDVMEGQWLLEPQPDSGGVIVTHEIRLKPGLPVPRWLVRRTLQHDLPDMLACMRGLANASGDGQRIADDLQRCAGDLSRVSK